MNKDKVLLGIIEIVKSGIENYDRIRDSKIVGEMLEYYDEAVRETYCDDSEQSTANAVDIEEWEEEIKKKLAQQNVISNGMMTFLNERIAKIDTTMKALIKNKHGPAMMSAEQAEENEKTIFEYSNYLQIYRDVKEKLMILMASFEDK